MELQGVWIIEFIDMYNPRMHWGAAPFRRSKKAAIVDIANSDMLYTARAKPPREAFDS